MVINDQNNLEDIEVEGVVVTVNSGAEIKPGDFYIARRNNPWQLLTCSEVHLEQGFIVAQEIAYPFDICNCKKVVAIDGEPGTKG